MTSKATSSPDMRQWKWESRARILEHLVASFFLGPTSHTCPSCRQTTCGGPRRRSERRRRRSGAEAGADTADGGLRRLRGDGGAGWGSLTESDCSSSSSSAADSACEMTGAGGVAALRGAGRGPTGEAVQCRELGDNSGLAQCLGQPDRVRTGARATTLSTAASRGTRRWPESPAGAPARPCPRGPPPQASAAPTPPASPTSRESPRRPPPPPRPRPRMRRRQPPPLR